MAGDDLEARLRVHVHELAGRIGERNVFRPKALARAEGYIHRELENLGYVVETQPTTFQGVTSRNMAVGRAGNRFPAQIILLGAHYDTVPDSPGADDNASAVAALLELARLFRGVESRRSVRFVAFTNEEPPFYATRDQGSRAYAAAARRRGEDIRLMVSLEMLGYYRDEPGSQQYPPLFRWFYPDRGNFIALVSNMRSRRRMRLFARAFRSCSPFPLEHVATFSFIPGVAWSDHFSFWKQGYPALMVTDTAFFRNPHYHTARDVPATLDFPRLAAVTGGLHGALTRLADAETL